MTEKGLPTEDTISTEIACLIESYVDDSISPIVDEEPETADFYREHERDFREYQYKFLVWLKNTTNTNKVLYAGSGYDNLPKHVLGEDSVIHTSLERYKGDTEEYFSKLVTGKKVIGENKQLPFGDSTFDTVMFFGLSEDIITGQIQDASRVIGVGGIIVIGCSMLNEINIENIDNFESITVPDRFQSDGPSEARFLIFKKKT